MNFSSKFTREKLCDEHWLHGPRVRVERNELQDEARLSQGEERVHLSVEVLARALDVLGRVDDLRVAALDAVDASERAAGDLT